MAQAPRPAATVSEADIVEARRQAEIEQKLRDLRAIRAQFPKLTDEDRAELSRIADQINDELFDDPPPMRPNDRR